MTNTSKPVAEIDLKKKSFGITKRFVDAKGNPSLSSKEDPSRWIDIDDIDIDWTKNKRGCLYKFKGKPCCFKESDVDDLLLSYPIHRQLQPVLVTVNQATRRQQLWDGYRRAFAVLVARKRGLKLPQGYALLCRKEIPPKTSDDWKNAHLRSAAMQSTKPFSPVDLAITAETLLKPAAAGGGGMSESEVCRQLGVLMQHNPNFRCNGEPIEEPQLKKLLRLNGLEPPEKLAVHEGNKKWTSALRTASKNGVGSSRGPQAPRGLKPTQAVRMSKSEAFAGAVPESVPRGELLAILGYSGDASVPTPEWFADAVIAFEAG